VVAAFVGQLARVLDGAELLERAVAVERALAHSEKLAAIGELAARIAHDIRNPVTAARSLAQARREEFHPVTLDVGGLVRATVDGLRPRLEAAGVALELALPGGLRAAVDAEKMRQALLNVLENALDALADAPGTRRLAVALAQDHGTATVRLTDNGPGVPPEALPRLFEPFFSLKPTGTGLGLAIARRTVEAHGGRIRAVAGDGPGLTVEITLPAVTEPARAAGGGRT
jgi:two-component system sensor histidine kinase HydH